MTPCVRHVRSARATAAMMATSCLVICVTNVRTLVVKHVLRVMVVTRAYQVGGVENATILVMRVVIIYVTKMTERARVNQAIMEVSVIKPAPQAALITHVQQLMDHVNVILDIMVNFVKTRVWMNVEIAQKKTNVQTVLLADTDLYVKKNATVTAGHVIS